MAGFLRITGGSLSRRRFLVPKAADSGLTRPTGDRARAAVFSSLGSAIFEASVLDLFAGSGAYGFEALSRGALSVLFVEKTRDTAQCIDENIRTLCLQDQCRVLAVDVLSFVQKSPAEVYDFIFVDPPYSLKLDTFFWGNLVHFLHKQSVVIFRCKSKKDFECPTGYQITRERSYGGTTVFFLTLGAI